MRVVNPLVPGAFGTSVGPASRRLTSIRYSSPDQSPRFDLLCPEPVASTPELTVRHRNHEFFSARKQQSLRVLERGWASAPSHWVLAGSAERPALQDSDIRPLSFWRRLLASILGFWLD